MTTFVDAVSRVMRNNTVLSGDDDDVISFDDLQHKATIQLAKQAIQSAMTDLASDSMLPVEETETTLTTVASQRVYDLPSDFVRLCPRNAMLLETDASDVAQNRFISEYPGGKDKLQREVLNYREQEGTPNWYYWPIQGTDKKIALYHVPDSVRYYRYTYEKSVYPETESDVLPFSTTQEDHAFLDMASRYFQFLFTQQPMTELRNDAIYNGAKTALMNLMRMNVPNSAYGYDYA